VEGLKMAGQRMDLRHENVIRGCVLIANLLEAPPVSAEGLKAWLNGRCIGVVVTKAEDARLLNAGLKSKMPDDWAGNDLCARYRAAGIKLAPAQGVNGREARVAHARAFLGDQRLVAFLRWARNEPEVFACKLINECLDKGETLDDIFSGPGYDGYKLEAEESGDGQWRIKFGCQAGPDAGDGGEWDVKFNAAGEVEEGFQTGCWIS
jgi:hypothetical protein